MLELNNKALLQTKCLINGEWVESSEGSTLDVFNPANGELVATVATVGAAQTEQAIAAAEAAQKTWKKKTAKERAALLRRWHDLLMENQEDLAKLMTAEQGKPLAESRGEIGYAASFIEWFAEEGKRIYGDVIPTYAPDRRLLVMKEPVGVCAAITP